MRVFLFYLLALLACLASSSPIDHNRKLVNRPTGDVIFRYKRSAPASFNGHNFPSPPPPTHVYPVKAKGGPTIRPVLVPRKGEYVCGENNDRLCKLTPGVVPEGCENHLCQYPIIP